MNVLNILTKQYTELHRKYHTLEHIAYMFNVANEYNVILSEAQRLAIWWHDAVYVLGSTTNEEDSIILMKDIAGLHDNLFEEVANIVLDTKNHTPRTEESAIVCDLDMFILADNFNVHYRYTQQIRHEYSGICVQRDYRIERIRFLEELLNKPIFHSNTFKQYRPKAVHAIEKEIKELKLLLDVGQ